MTDIVERLRLDARVGLIPDPICVTMHEAADEIERLRAAGDQWLLEAVATWKHRAEAAEAGWKACAECADAARSEALEEAAKVAEDMGHWGQVAAAIRALAKKEPT